MPSPWPLPKTERPSTVLIADDSVVVRGLIARWLGDSDDFHVVAVAGDGEAAIEQAARHRPDIVILDIDMPVLDGVAALPRLLGVSPATAVVMTTTLSERNARLALQCMTLGAVDVLPKPESRIGLTGSLDFQRDLFAKLSGIRQARRQLAPPPVLAMTAEPAPRHEPPPAPLSLVPPRYLLIGASTGGPRAVTRVLSDLGPALSQLTTLIVQHMPPLFTTSFAEQIAVQTGLPAHEPVDGEPLVCGAIYVAPGGRHLGIDRRHGQVVAHIDDGPPVRFCRPAVDVLFGQAAQQLGASALALILTGMGSDGTDGAGALRRAGATVIAQDEPTSTVWGMPGSVVRAHHASAVLPLGAIGQAIRTLVTEGRA